MYLNAGNSVHIHINIYVYALYSSCFMQTCIQMQEIACIYTLIYTYMLSTVVALCKTDSSPVRVELATTCVYKVFRQYYAVGVGCSTSFFL